MYRDGKKVISNVIRCARGSNTFPFQRINEEVVGYYVDDGIGIKFFYRVVTDVLMNLKKR